MYFTFLSFLPINTALWEVFIKDSLWLLYLTSIECSYMLIHSLRLTAKIIERKQITNNNKNIFFKVDNISLQ